MIYRVKIFENVSCKFAEFEFYNCNDIETDFGRYHVEKQLDEELIKRGFTPSFCNIEYLEKRLDYSG